MFTLFLALFVLVTGIGTLAILRLAGVPIFRLLVAPDSTTGKIAQTVVCLGVFLAAVVHISFQPRLWGEPAFPWAFLPFGVYLWVRCIYLVRSRNVS